MLWISCRDGVRPPSLQRTSLGRRDRDSDCRAAHSAMANDQRTGMFRFRLWRFRRALRRHTKDLSSNLNPRLSDQTKIQACQALAPTHVDWGRVLGVSRTAIKLIPQDRFATRARSAKSSQPGRCGVKVILAGIDARDMVFATIVRAC